MGWTLTRDLDEYAEHAVPLLSATPAENTVALTVIDQMKRGLRLANGSDYFGWYRDDSRRVAGAFSLTPPYELLLGVATADMLPELVMALRAAGAEVPGINGSVELAHRLAELWGEPTVADLEPYARQRLYRLGSLVVPDPAPAGAARRASSDDLDLVVEWFGGFEEETGSHRTDRGDLIRFRIDAELMWLWDDDHGQTVSLAARNATVADVARVGPVYTPPEYRRHGYGAAVTAACTADALARDATEVVLFTDLANPTSNAIYQSIGYRGVSDRAVYRFPTGQ